MFRVAVLSIALTLTVAPESPVLCSLWCHSTDQATGECPHQGAASTTSLAPDDRCRDMSQDVTAFIREDGPRVAAASAGGQAVAVPSYRLTEPTTELRRIASSERAWALEGRPRDIALRL